MRIIYSIDEAIELTKLAKDDLIALGSSGILRFFIEVPDDVKIGNVGWGDMREEVHAKESWMLEQFPLPPPIWETKLDWLALSPESCKMLQARGRLRQVQFALAARQNCNLQLEIIRPHIPKADPLGFAPRHSFIRVFAAYDRHVSWQDGVPATARALTITTSDLQIGAAELLPYLITQEQKPNNKPALSRGKKTGRGQDEVSDIIEEIYLQASDEERKVGSNGPFWRKFKECARQKRPPLLHVTDDEVYYEKLYVPKEEKEKKAKDQKKVMLTLIISRKDFGDRLRLIREKKALSSKTV